jgi:thymidylate synthase (FAD)
VKESKERYIKPPEIYQDKKNIAEGIFNNAMKEAWGAYRKLLNIGIKPEIARYVLPNACETQIVMTMNFRELRHFIKIRTSEAALPEMRAVAGEIRKIMKEKAPKVFEDL